MDFTQILTHLLSGTSGAAIILGVLKAFAMWEKKQGRSPQEPKYKNDFLEKVGSLMEAQTILLQKSNSHLERFDPVIMAVDSDTLTPRIWPDKKQAQRTHENVNNLVDIMGEMGKSVEAIEKKLAG